MMMLEGELQSVALPHVLESVSAVEGSGILTVQGEDDIVAVSFLNGAIVAADALNQTVEEGLGKALQEDGIISPGDFDAVAQEHQGGSSGSLGDVLIQRGLISRDDLLRGLRQQTFRLMLEILTWKQGEFKFYGGDEVSYEDGFRPLPVDELLIRSFEDSGASADLPPLDTVYRPAASSVTVRILGRDGDGSEPGVWLSQRQADFLAALDGSRTAADLAQGQHLGEYEGRYTVYKLDQQGLISATSGGPVPERPRAAAPPPAAIEPPVVLQPPPEPPAPNLDAIPTAPPQDVATPAEAGLRAEIFMPPEPAGGTPEADFHAEYGTPPPPRPAAEPWLGPGLAIVLLACLAWSFSIGPGSRALGGSLLPFPSQEDQRGALERQVRQSLFLRIDRAAKTYFLAEAHYPDSLDDLIELGLLSPSDLLDPSGIPLSYSTDAVGYRIDIGSQDASAQDFGATESITGDFLLDPQWSPSSTSGEAPVFLID